MKRKLLYLCVLLLAVKSQAQLIFQDDFSTYLSNTELSGQGLWSNSPIAPNVGIGACLPLSSSATCSGTKVLDQAISYLNYGNAAKAIEIGPYRDGVAHVVSPVVSGGNFYLGLVLNLSSAPLAAGSPVDFLRVINSDPTLVTFRLLVKDAGFGYNIGIRKGASGNATVYAPNLLNYDENVLIVIKYTHLDGLDDDAVSLFVNPDFAAGEPANPNIVTTSGMDQSGAIDRVAFRLNYNVATAMPAGYAGLVSAATAWQGLGFIPLKTNSFNRNSIFVSSQTEQQGLNIESTQNFEQVSLKLYSMNGSLMEEQKLNLASGLNTVALTHKISTGWYLLSIQDEQGLSYRQKILINH